MDNTSSHVAEHLNVDHVLTPSSSDLPRERLLTLGVGALSDAELVAIHLGTGRRGQHVLTAARELLTEFGGVTGLARAGVDELARHPGIGPAKAARLVAAFALADRVTTSDHTTIRTSEDIARFAMARIGRARTEEVLLFVLDGGNRVRHVLPLAKGGATRSDLPLREALSLTLRHDGIAFALAHNHPGGSPHPSPADREATARLRTAATHTGLRFLDHVIVTTDDWRSITATD